MQQAIRVGLKPKQFWRSTPRELAISARAYHQRLEREGLFIAWHTAALSRVEEFPSLAELLAEPKTPEQIEAERIEAERVHQELMAEHARMKKVAADFNAAVRKNG